MNPDDETMVKDCAGRESRMTKWEKDFIQSITERLEDDRGLTDRQSEILNRIWEKVTSRG